jgi:TPR repeat protein
LKEAVKIYLGCIDQGCARAHFELGCMYSIGEGAEEDKQQALEQCKISGEMGFTDASMALAQAYAGLRLGSNS